MLDPQTRGEYLCSHLMVWQIPLGQTIFFVHLHAEHSHAEHSLQGIPSSASETEIHLETGQGYVLSKSILSHSFLTRQSVFIPMLCRFLSSIWLSLRNQDKLPDPAGITSLNTDVDTTVEICTYTIAEFHGITSIP